ncbi:MAG: hypothetical protein ABIR16_07565 [Dokdonella sp.]
MRWDSTAFNAGLGSGTIVIAVDDLAYDKDSQNLDDAITAAKNAKASIKRLVKEFNGYRTVTLDYHLERIEGTPDRLSKIFAARK